MALVTFTSSLLKRWLLGIIHELAWPIILRGGRRLQASWLSGLETTPVCLRSLGKEKSSRTGCMCLVGVGQKEQEPDAS